MVTVSYPNPNPNPNWVTVSYQAIRFQRNPSIRLRRKQSIRLQRKLNQKHNQELFFFSRGELSIDEFAALMSMDATIKDAVQLAAEQTWGVGQKSFALNTLTYKRRRGFKEKVTEASQQYASGFVGLPAEKKIYFSPSFRDGVASTKELAESIDDRLETMQEEEVRWSVSIVLSPESTLFNLGLGLKPHSPP